MACLELIMRRTYCLLIAISIVVQESNPLKQVAVRIKQKPIRRQGPAPLRLAPQIKYIYNDYDFSDYDDTFYFKVSKKPQLQYVRRPLRSGLIFKSRSRQDETEAQPQPCDKIYHRNQVEKPVETSDNSEPESDPPPPPPPPPKPQIPYNYDYYDYFVIESPPPPPPPPPGPPPGWGWEPPEAPQPPPPPPPGWPAPPPPSFAWPAPQPSPPAAPPGWPAEPPPPPPGPSGWPAPPPPPSSSGWPAPPPPPPKRPKPQPTKAPAGWPAPPPPTFSWPAPPPGWSAPSPPAPAKSKSKNRNKVVVKERVVVVHPTVPPPRQKGETVIIEKPVPYPVPVPVPEKGNPFPSPPKGVTPFPPVHLPIPELPRPHPPRPGVGQYLRNVWNRLIDALRFPDVQDVDLRAVNETDLAKNEGSNNNGTFLLNGTSTASANSTTKKMPKKHTVTSYLPLPISSEWPSSYSASSSKEGEEERK